MSVIGMMMAALTLRLLIPTSTPFSKRKTTSMQFVYPLTRTYSAPLSIC